MSSRRALQAWLIACGSAALLLSATAGLLLQRRPAPAVAPASGATDACGLPSVDNVRALPGAEGPPVLLWATGGVHLYLDDAPAFSPPEAPRHFTVGEHSVRLEAEGHPPLLTRLRFEPWTPALLHAQVDPGIGLTLVRLNAPCTVCPAPTRPVDRVPYAPSTKEPTALLGEAASALRQNAWPQALAALEGVPPDARRSAHFLRLASAVHVDAWAQAASREALEALPARDARDLAPLLSRLDALTAAEDGRRHRVQLERWNRTTERFGGLVRRFEPQVPQAVGAAARRLEVLTRAFETKHTARDTLGAEEALLAAEESLSSLVTQLRSARPGDCAFQAEVVATAAR